MFHGAEKPVCAPCRSPSAGFGSAAAGEPSARCWHSAGAMVGTGVSSGRHGRAEENRGEQRGKERRGSRPPHTASVRGTTCFRSTARGVEDEQRHLPRKQPLEEDDNGPMTLELLAVPDEQLVAAVGSLFF